MISQAVFSLPRNNVDKNKVCSGVHRLVDGGTRNLTFPAASLFFHLRRCRKTAWFNSMRWKTKDKLGLNPKVMTGRSKMSHYADNKGLVRIFLMVCVTVFGKVRYFRIFLSPSRLFFFSSQQNVLLSHLRTADSWTGLIRFFHRWIDLAKHATFRMPEPAKPREVVHAAAP